MAESAKVRSIDALKDFRAALCKFIEAARNSLGEAAADLQRCGTWLSEERQPYWKSELTRRTYQHRRAKMALLEKKLEKTAAGGRPSCVDEEKALAIAQRRLEEAETKGTSTRIWIRRLDEQIFQYKGMIQGLNHSLDVDAANMLALLERMIAALDAYVALAPPPGIDADAAMPQDTARNGIISEAIRAVVDAAEAENDRPSRPGEEKSGEGIA